jgi:B12-binding domain/radical SAM domain protein
MPEADIVLVHPPSVFDFRSRATAFGPVSDVVPSTSVFEMYPLGFLTMASFLSRHGLKARIANLALRMLRSGRFDPVRFLSRVRARAFGIDLHWLVHAQGALEVARLLKRLHPRVPIIFGGLSATYYHEELMRLPFVDFVVLGDSAERPLALLLRALREGRGLEEVPNLAWKRDGEPVSNGLGWVPCDLDHLSLDYREIVRSALRHADPLGHLPYLGWPREGTAALLPFRGCVRDCAVCGGSRSAYSRFFGRERLGVRGPETLARDVEGIASLLRGPIVILGDLRMGGDRYAERFFEAAARRRVGNPVMLELHRPADREFLERAGRAFGRLNLQISPESHDGALRERFGKPYKTAEMETFLEDASCLCDRVDVFFMIGLAGQTRRTVAATVDYCEELVGRRARGARVHPHVAPLAPFLDPGSRAFESPAEHGYRLLRRTLAEHAEALLSLTWHEALNYETEWMGREEIARATYDSALRLARAKARHGLISGSTLARIERRVGRAVDGRASSAGRPYSDGETVMKEELRWPAGPLPVRPLAFAGEALAYVSGRTRSAPRRRA